MKPFAVGLLVAFSLAALLHDAQASDELVVEAGHDLAVTVGFPIGEGNNTNPAVVQASVDSASGRITLSGRKPG
ncbi:MAG TPA: hypothetical protein VMV18_10125, partial [bacterium]|nr:hypothetical protein [bacterium]